MISASNDWLTHMAKRDEPMESVTDWSAVAGNGSCVPMPKTTTEISDRFVAVWMGAPEFSSLQKVVKYPLTLDMMLGVLRAAVAHVASRCKNEDAKAAYLESLDELARAFEHYRAGEVKMGRVRVQLARHLFRWGALPRSRSMAARYVELLRKELADGGDAVSVSKPSH